MNILGMIWWILFWSVMGGIVYGVYLRNGVMGGIDGAITVFILFWWFRTVGFFSKTE